MPIFSSPFTKQPGQLGGFMREVVYATIPGVVALIYCFGWGIFVNIILACSFAVIFEALILKLRNRNVRHGIMDFSAIVTAILLAISLPSFAPWWITLIGVFFAIVITKHLYGGVGFNIFNPAMAGYVLLLISFPVQMTTWSTPLSLMEAPLSFWDTLCLIFTEKTSTGLSLSEARQLVDSITQATALDNLKTNLGQSMMAHEIFEAPIYGVLGSVGWQWPNVLFLLGGIYLYVRKIINWHISVSMLLTILLVMSIFHMADQDAYASPLFHLFSGATMLGAFFIATDPVSAATTIKGRLIFGCGIGLLVCMIRLFGGYPDAIAFAVLLMNMSAPLIDQLCQPRTYGYALGKNADKDE